MPSGMNEYMISENKSDLGANHLPDQCEIARVCAAIRAGWSEAEYKRRLGVPTEHQEWMPPLVKINEPGSIEVGLMFNKPGGESVPY